MSADMSPSHRSEADAPGSVKTDPNGILKLDSPIRYITGIDPITTFCF